MTKFVLNRVVLAMFLLLSLFSIGTRAHELTAPVNVIANDDGTFEPSLVFTAGPEGAILNRLTATYIQSFSIAFGAQVDYGCAVELGPGESMEVELPENFDTLFDFDRPVLLDLELSTECPGDPEFTVLPLFVYALPAFCDDAEVLCLHNGRFKVQVEYPVPEDNPRSGEVGFGASQKSGTFWFFDQDTVEVLVKVVDGCAVNGHYWLYLTGATDLPYSAFVTNTFFDEDYVLDQNSEGLSTPLIDTLFSPCP